jgi:hypothetical protein
MYFYVPPKCQALQEPHGVTSQKTAFFIVTALETSNLTNEPLSQINKKSSVCGIFCDLTKAFDTVNHDIVMIKLQCSGIVGKFGECNN